MNDLNNSTALLITVVIVTVVAALILWLDHNTKTRGNLFTRPPTLVMRVFAGLLGLVFGLIGLYEFMERRAFEFGMLLPTIALIAYSFGATGFLMRIQQGGHKTAPGRGDLGQSGSRRWLKLLLTFVFGVVGIVLTIYGCAWMLKYADTLSPVILVIGIIILSIAQLGGLLSLFEIYRAFKRANTRK